MTSLPNCIRRTQGVIGYRNADAKLVGREEFALNYSSSGIRLEANCDLQRFQLTRVVSIAMDVNWLPEHGSLRLAREGKPILSSEFDVGHQQITVSNQLANGTKREQVLPNQSGVKYLGLHPLQGDALVTTQLPKMLRANTFYNVPAITNSVSENGDEGEQASLLDISVAYVGIEPLTVSAGRFMARRFKLSWHPKWPPAYLWTMIDQPIFLKMVWSQVPYWYELMSLRQLTLTNDVIAHPSLSDYPVDHSFAG